MTDRIISVSKTTIGTGEHAFGNNLVPEDTLNAGDTLTVNAGIALLATGTDAHGIKSSGTGAGTTLTIKGTVQATGTNGNEISLVAGMTLEIHLGGSKRLCDRQALWH